MECKLISIAESKVIRRELIETLWNVNEVKEVGNNEKAEDELIETLWNVNF